MRRAPRPWGEELWERVAALLERVEAWIEEDPELQEGDGPELLADVRATRREMVAEEARRAR